MNKNTSIQNLVSRVADRLALRNDSSALLAEEEARPLVIEALEPRILFSGSPAPAEPAPAESNTVQEAPAPAESDASADAAPAEETTVAAPPEATAPAPEGAEQGDAAVALTDAELSALTDAASGIWAGSGISDAQGAALASATYQIADLGGNILGRAEGNVITIDDDGAGRGWSIDDTPGDGVAASTTGVDLLSVLLHEQGHLLGLDHSGGAADIMYELFIEGESRLPDVGQADGAIAGSLEGVHFAEWATNNNANWNDAANWDNPDTIPDGVDAVADFSTIDITNHRNINVETAITVGSLLLGDASGGHTYRFYDGTAGTLTFDVSSGNASLSNNSGGADSFNNTIILNDTLEISGNTDLNFIDGNTTISGTGGIIYNGTATLGMRGSVAGQYSYTGDTVVNSGIYLGSHALNGNLPANSNLQINEAIYQGYYNANLLSPLGTGAGEFQLTGGTAAGFNYNNNLTIRFGNNSNNVVQWGSAVFDPGTLLLGNTRASGGGDGNFDNKLDLNGAPRTFHVTAGHDGLEWVMKREILDTVGGASIVKSGNGVLRLDAANTFTGGVTINGGSIRTNSAGALGSGDVDVENGGTLEINVADAIDDTAILTLNGAAAGASKLILNADETVDELWIDGTQFAVGTYDSAGGIVDISGTGTLTVLNGPAAPAIEITIKTNNDVVIVDGDNSASIPGTDFGDVDTVAGSELLTFKITNNGTGDLTLSAQPTVDDTVNYTVSTITGPDLVLAADETQTFTVTFDPDSGGAKPATVTVLSDDPDEGTYTFGITGTGVVPQDAIWTLNNNGDWDVDGNWNPSAAFGIGAVADFSQIDITNHRNINVETGVTVGSILLGDTSGTHTYRFYDGTSGALTFDVVSGNATLSNISGGTDSFNNTIILNDTLEISGGSLDFSNGATNISGTGGIIYNGTGTLSMRGDASGQYSYTGDTVVNSGIYLGSHAHNGNLPAGNVQINEALYQGYYNAGLVRPLGTGAGEFQLTGGTAAGFNYNNNLTIRFGDNSNNVVQWGSATFDPGTLLLGNTRTSGGGDGNFDNILDLNGAARTFDVTAGHAGLEWVMKREIRDTVGGASIVKDGNGVLRLDAANTFTGGVTISDGSIRTNSAGALGSGNVDVENGGTLEIDVADAIDDAAMLTVNGTGKLILDANETVDQLWVDGAQLAAGDYDASSLDVDISGAGTLTVVSGGITIEAVDDAYTTDDNTVLAVGPPSGLLSNDTGGGSSDLFSQLGILDLNANGGINPATGAAWAEGDTYRLTFATSTRTDGSGDIAFYNDFVQTHADNSSLGLGSVDWTAIASTNAVNAVVNTGTDPATGGVSIWQMNGTEIIADNYGDLWDGSQTSAEAIDRTENNTAPPTWSEGWGRWSGTWTGTNSNGTTAGQALGDGGNANVGLANGAASGGQWTARSSITESELNLVYGISEVLTVQAVPDDISVTQVQGSGGLTATTAQGATVTANPDGSFTYDTSTSATLQAMAEGDPAMTDTFTYTISEGASTGALISGVTVESASSFYSPDGRLPEDSINGVGLDAGAGTHNNNPRDMWLSNNEEAPEITYDLEGNYDLGSIHVWNYNEHSNNPAAFTARGANEVEILVAETVGGAFTSLGTFNFAQADGTNTYAGEEIALTGANNVRLIRFDIKSDHGGDNYTGLSEVQFFEAPAAGGSATDTATVTITVEGANDAAVISAISDVNITETIDTSDITSNFTVDFTDVDLADTGHSTSITGAVATGYTAVLGLDETGLIDLVTVNSTTKASGSSAGSASLTFTAASTDFDYLPAGETVTITYTIEVNDGDDTGSTTFDVVITGTDDLPVAGADSASTDEDTILNGTSVLDNDEDVDLPRMMVSQLGVLNLSANGGNNPTTGLPWSPGDTYRLVFVTSTRTTGDGDIAFYNNFVQTHADGSSLGLDSVTWSAIASTATVNAMFNTGTDPAGGTGESIWLMNGTQIVADDYADFWDNNHSSAEAIDRDENNAAAITWAEGWGRWSGTWTGTNGNGTTSGNALGDGGNAAVGLASGAATAGQWTARGADDETTFLNLVYGLSEVLTVDAPAPPLVITGINGTTSLTGTSTLGANLTMNADGTYIYDPSTAAIQALKEGDNPTDTFTYTITGDGGATTATATVSIDLTGLNDAPVLGTGVAGFNDVGVSQLDNDGDLVSDLVNLQISDVDAGSVEGIAITGTGVTGGGWFEYSTDGGGTWSMVGPVSDNGALLLTTTAMDRIRFVPDGTTTDASTLTFRAWDQTGGTVVEALADTSGANSGGTSPFSADARTVSVSIAELIKDGSEIVYAPTDGEINTLTVHFDPGTGELVFVDTTGGTIGSGFAGGGTQEVRVAVASGDSLTIETGDMDDKITVGDMGLFDGTLTIMGEEGFDEILLANGASVSLGADEDLLVDGETFRADLDSSVSVLGDGTISVTAAGGVGDFAGLNLRRASLSSEGGGITLTGVGGDTGNTNDGVVLTHGSTVSTGGGSVTVTGTATSTTGANDGISLKGGSDITAGGAGGITLTGTSGGVNSSYGVQLFSGTEVTTAGGDIAIVGSSDAVGSRNAGIYTNGATVTAGGAGSVAMTGTGGGAGSNNNGLSLAATAVDAGTSGDVTLVGMGGGGTSGNGGVQVGTRTSVSADGGNVTITGTGGAGTGVRNTGVSLLSGSSVSSGGDTEITGVAGTGTSRNGGVVLTSATLAATGDLTVDGTGNGTGSNNSGISSSRSTLGGAEVTLAGTGSTSSTAGRFNDGVSISRGGVTATGTLTIDAAGGTGSRDNRGLMVSRAALGGTLAVTGSADPGSGSRSTGVFIQNSVLSDDGTIAGTGGAAGLGVYMRNITGGNALGVTTTPDTDDEKRGNFFDAVLPAFLLLGAGGRTKARRGAVGASVLDDELQGRIGAAWGGIRGEARTADALRTQSRLGASLLG